MMKTNSILFYLVLGWIFFSCQPPNKYADKVIINGDVQTVNANFDKAEAVAIKDGKILQVGTNEEIMKWVSDDHTSIVDVKGAFVMPGFIEGHGHFTSVGRAIQNLNLINTKSWQEIVQAVKGKVDQAKDGEWIVGRGWHQEKWNQSPGPTVNGYPSHKMLSEISPNNPVVLYHASGHGLMANEQAMNKAKVSVETPDPVGGAIVRDASKNAIGVFEENAMGVITSQYYDYIHTLPAESVEQKWQESVQLAAQESISKGITSFQDAGSSFDDVRRFKVLAEEGKLPLRLWAMIRHSSKDMKGRLNEVKMIDVGNKFFTCKAIKTELDGALGSYGAWLLESYDDRDDFKGQNTTTVEEVETIAKMAIEHDMQLCVHAIGDRANREVLDIVERLGKEKTKAGRWRMEHTQHIDPTDIPRFKELGVIASMQAIHCTSDSPFVVDRLGEKRAREGAYVWRSLIDAGAVVTNGTDAPIEDVNPLASYYASVTRKRSPGEPAFFPEQALTREEGLRAYTISNAYAAFEEEWKGSLEVGKVADITVLSKNIVTCPEDEILNANVLYTIVDGEIKYKNVK